MPQSRTAWSVLVGVALLAALSVTVSGRAFDNTPSWWRPPPHRTPVWCR